MCGSIEMHAYINIELENYSETWGKNLKDTDKYL